MTQKLLFENYISKKKSFFIFIFFLKYTFVKCVFVSSCHILKYSILEFLCDQSFYNIALF